MKQVSFEDKVKVRKTLHWNDFTDEESAATWYTDDEYQEIKKDIRRTMRKMNTGKLDKDNDVYCRRGLECRNKKIFTEKQEKRVASCIAVLQVQELFRMGKCSGKMISRVYKMKARDSKEEAYALGMEDQEEAQSTYQLMRNSIYYCRAKSSIPQESRALQCRLACHLTGQMQRGI